MEGSIEERLLTGAVLRQTELLQNEFITLHTVILRAKLLGYSKPDFRASLGKLTGPWAGQPKRSVLVIFVTLLL